MKKRSTFGKRIFPSSLVPNTLFSLLAILSVGLLPSRSGAQTCNGNVVLSVTGASTNTWTAPAGGPFSIRINATGGGGGNVTDFGALGGSGAVMSGEFVVQSGQTIRLIGGAPGGDAAGVGAGGGGGSGAVDCGFIPDCASGTVLVIAAGGNGDNGPGGAGLGGSSLTDGDGLGGPDGGDATGGGGGGLFSAGLDAPNSGGFGGFQVSLEIPNNGGNGNINGGGPGGNGMGGGGGGGDEGSGGGGGHTGGDGSNSVPAKSFNSGDNQSNSDGANGNVGGFANLGTVDIVCLQVLPVELINFKALIQHNNEVMLLWSTASEKDNLGYDVERSADNHNWSQLGFVPGNGTSTVKQEYTFHDEKPLAGVNYYRLKQMDTDGKYQYTPMVVADVRSGGSQFDVFPNPSINGTLSVRAVSTKDGDAKMELYSWAGLRVYKETFRAYEGTMVWPLNLTTFPKGTYTARLEMPDGSVQFKKVVLQ